MNSFFWAPVVRFCGTQNWVLLRQILLTKNHPKPRKKSLQERIFATGKCFLAMLFILHIFVPF